MIYKTKHKVETQKYTININLFREITSTKMKHSNLFAAVILLFINEHYRKANKEKKQKTKLKQKAKTKQKNKNKPDMKLIAPAPLLFHFERN